MTYSKLYLTGLRCTACLAVIAAAQPILADAPAIKQSGKWAQDYTGRQADPSVRFGQLSNGVRYAILKNSRPEGAVSFRMRIGSGSLQEHDDELGLAHFIEHMAFRGSTNVADGEVVKMLERQGLQFGADTNAGTIFDETIYQFDFPHADASAITTGLTLFREIGGGLKLDPAAIDAERGVVLSEERARDNAGLHMLKAQFNFAYAGQRLATRFPIGTIESLKAATPAKLRRYYETNYRPDNTTIIVVGAVDVADVEAKIKTMFGDWQSAAPAETVPLGTVQPRGPAIAINAEAGAPDIMFIDWQRPFDTSADTDARERADVVRLIGSSIFNRRLQEAAQQANAPFLGAALSVNGVYKTATQTQIFVQPRKDQVDAAIKAIIGEQRQILNDGVRDDEIASAKVQLAAQFKAAAAGAATRENKAIADGMVTQVNEDDVITSPAQDLALYQQIEGSVTKRDVDASLKLVFSGAGPLVMRSTPDAQSNAQAALDATLKTALTAPLAKAAALKVEPWPYTTFGPATKITARREIKDLGITLVTFANGVHLAIKSTNFSKDSIQVQVSFGHGRLGIPAAQTHAAWLLGDGNAFLLGGTGKRTLTQIQRETEGKVASVSFAAADDHFNLAGTTNKADFTTQLQLLAGYVSDPGFRADGVDRIKSSIAGQLPLLDSIPGAVFARDGAALLHNGDRRWMQLPTASDVAGTVAADIPAVLRAALAEPVNVSVVGDVSVEEAVRQVAATFGALHFGKAPLHQSAGEMALRVKSAAPVILPHKGRADQGILAEYWPTGDFYKSPADSYALRVTSAVIESRLVDTAREKLGLTYSPQAQVESSTSLPGYGYLAVINETKPSNIAQFQLLIKATVNALASKPVTPDEFARAQKPLIDSRQKMTQTNGYWVGNLTALMHDPRCISAVRNYVSGVAAVKPSDISRVAQAYLVNSTPLTLEVVPAAK